MSTQTELTRSKFDWFANLAAWACAWTISIPQNHKWRSEIDKLLHITLFLMLSKLFEHVYYIYIYKNQMDRWMDETLTLSSTRWFLDETGANQVDLQFSPKKLLLGTIQCECPSHLVLVKYLENHSLFFASSRYFAKMDTCAHPAERMRTKAIYKSNRLCFLQNIKNLQHPNTFSHIKISTITDDSSRPNVTNEH